MSIPYFNDLDGRITVERTVDAYKIYVDGELFTMLDNTISSDEFRKSIDDVIADLTTTE